MSMPIPRSLAVCSPSDAMARCEGFTSAADKPYEIAESRQYHSDELERAHACGGSDWRARHALEWLDAVERGERPPGGYPSKPYQSWGLNW